MTDEDRQRGGISSWGIGSVYIEGGRKMTDEEHHDRQEQKLMGGFLIYGIDGFVFIETSRTNGVQIVIDVEVERAKELLAELASAIKKAELPIDTS